jgi:hypothetical protein
MQTSGSPVGGNGTTTVDLIPIGSNYTVKLTIYNASFSSSTPTLTGTTSGVSVGKDANTAVTITCRPYSPSSVSSPYSTTLSLGQASEQWYAFSAMSGSTYYFTQDNSNFSMGLFDSGGNIISTSTSFISYNATSDGTLYVGIVSCTSSAASCTFAISTTEPSLNEGSLSSPITITLDADRNFRIGPSNSSSNQSYYRFTATESGDYALNTPNNNGYYSPRLSISSTFSDSYLNQSIYGGAKGCIFYGLSAGTTYYLSIFNNTGAIMNESGRMMSPSALASAAKGGEGSLSSPAQLSLGTQHSASIGINGYDYVNYYKFTTGSGIDYSIDFGAMNSVSLFVDLMSDESYTTYVQSDNFWNGRPASAFVLSPSKTYYLRIRNSNSFASSFPITITATSAPSFIDLPVADSWTEGNLATQSSILWYKAAVTAGETYMLFMDNGSEGSGSYKSYCYASAYQSDRVTAYFNNQNRLYTNYQLITVPTGQTELYVRVYENGGTFALKLVKAPDSGSLVITAQ